LFAKVANNILHEKHSGLKDKVKFIEGDACHLSPELGKFDVVFAGNLIDRISDP
jgi:ubiquinone/menaquinone biosynthesis C-methylase UbiE